MILSPRFKEVEISSGAVTLHGLLLLPRGADGIVIAAHNSGSGRLSPRNHLFARTLAEAELATLLPLRR